MGQVVPPFSRERVGATITGVRWAMYRLRADLTRRLLGPLVVALLVALVGSATLASVAGARRTTTATDRLREAGREPDASVDASQTDPARFDEILALPAVEEGVALAFVYAFPEDEGFHPFLTPTGDHDDGVSRGNLVQGRRPDPAEPHEVALSEHSAARLGLSVGDELPLATFTPAGAAAMESDDEVAPDGPPVTLEVVGIVRYTFDVQARSDDPTFTILTPAFTDRYQDEVALAPGQLFLRLHEGADGLEALGAQLRETFPAEDRPLLLALGSGGDALGASMAVLSTGLLAFAAVIAVFGLAAVGQAMSRTLAGREHEQLPLAALGADRRDRALDAWLPVAAAAVVGSVLAALGAWAASPLLPFGLGRRTEPDPGVHLDVPVVVGGAFVLGVASAALAGALAWRLAARHPMADRATVPRPASWLVGRVLQAGSPTVAVGVAMAVRPHRRAVGVPVRTATLGVLGGVTGVVAIALFSGTMDRLLDEPARYGWPWHVSVAGADAEELAERGDVAAVTEVLLGASVDVEGEPTPAAAFEDVKGSVAPTVVEGRRPASPTEVAVGAATRASLADPDRATVLDAQGEPHELDVVGTMLFPTVDDPLPLDTGIAFTRDALDRLGLGATGVGDPAYERTLVRYEEGVDVQEAVAELGIDAEDVSFAAPPAEVERLEQVGGLPRLLAAFLVALAALSVAHALWQTVRRRRHELAVLRAIGFDRRQVRWAITWQSATIGLAGALVGVPLGLAAGRVGWSLLARELGIQPGVLTGVAPLGGALGLLAAAAAGVAFGSMAARQPASVGLRDE